MTDLAKIARDILLAPYRAPESTGGRRVISSAVPADRAEVLSDPPALDARTELHFRERAEEEVCDAILGGPGYKVGGTTWDLEVILDCAVADGGLPDLAARLHAITKSYGDARTEAVDDLIDWLRERVRQHFPERVFDDLADELAQEG